MTRDMFLSFKRFLHVADNENLEAGNKSAKVQPVYNILNHNLAQLGVFHQQLSINEAMVPYRGLHSAKMYMQGKPIRFGFREWCICGTNGYPYKISIYTGKEGSSDVPLGTKVVNNMLSVVWETSAFEKHEIFFDNFFASYKLLKDLRAAGVKAKALLEHLGQEEQ